MTITETLEGITVLGVDIAPLIYFTEDHPKYAPLMEKIFKHVDAGQLHLLTSTITLTEALTKPVASNDQPLLKQYSTLFNQTEGITVVPPVMEIAERGAALRAKYQLLTPDALQIATTIHLGCDAFLTNDLRLRRISKEIPVLILDDFVEGLST